MMVTCTELNIIILIEFYGDVYVPVVTCSALFNMACLRKLVIILNLLLLANVSLIAAKENDGEEKDKWKKKHITDYTEADVERLYEQWEVS